VRRNPCSRAAKRMRARSSCAYPGGPLTYLRETRSRRRRAQPVLAQADFITATRCPSYQVALIYAELDDLCACRVKMVDGKFALAQSAARLAASHHAQRVRVREGLEPVRP
jgi:hypothetical protein